MTANASTAFIRQWARAQGMTVGDRGRLSPQVLHAYSASHSQHRPASAPTVRKTNKKRDRAQLRVPVRPLPGATGTARTIAARAAA